MKGIFETLKPYVRLSGDEWRAPWKIPDRTLLDFLLVHIVRGQGPFTVGKVHFNVTDNDLIWVPPDILHAMAGTSERMHVRWVHFDLQYDPRRSHWSAYIPGNTFTHGRMQKHMHPPVTAAPIAAWAGRLRLPNHAVIGGLMEKLCFEHLFAGPGAQTLLSGLMFQIIGEIERGTVPSAGTLASGQWVRMQGMLQEIRQNAESALSVAALAQKAHVSASHFRKLFRETHGQSPRTLHRLARLQRGRDLLMTTPHTISEIAHRLGFSTVHNFSRSFKAVYGIAPLRFRKGGNA